MKREELAPEFVGIPVCTGPEADFLLDKLDSQVIDLDYSITDVGKAIRQHNKEVEAIVQHDLFHFRRESEIRHLSESEVIDFERGIQDGYDFILGCMAYILNYRAGQPEIQDDILYLSGTPSAPLLPIETVHRVKQVRAGHALTDKAARMPVVATSRDWAYRDQQDYFRRSPALRSVLDEYIRESVWVEQYSDEDPWIGGLHHGVSNAIELFIQAYEEDMSRHSETSTQ